MSFTQRAEKAAEALAATAKPAKLSAAWPSNPIRDESISPEEAEVQTKQLPNLLKTTDLLVI